MPELGPQTYPAVDAFVEATADLDAEARADAIRRAIGAASTAGKAGWRDLRRRISRGERASDRRCDEQRAVRLSPHNRCGLLGHRADAGRTGSGWAHGGARDWNAVDPVVDWSIAAQKAVASRNPQEIPPGLYTAVLEPQAVTDLIPLLGGALNARNADEGRSAFSKPGGGTRIGEKVADERITLYSDPADTDLRGPALRWRGPSDSPHGLDREGHPEEPRRTVASGPRSRESSRPALRSPEGSRWWAEARAQRN